MVESPERTLYQFPISHYCEKTRWHLDAKGLPYVTKNLVPGVHRLVLRRSLGLRDATVPAADELVGLRVLAVTNEALSPRFEVCQDDRALVRARDLGELAQEFRTRLADPDVDLAAARKTDAEREVVRNPIREQPRLAAAQDFARSFIHVVLDTTARNRAGELSALRDRELRADGPWRGPPRRNDEGKGDALTARLPTLEVRQELPHGSNASPVNRG